jgi:nitrate reductase beta subunit
VGRIRYIGIILYDADRILESASAGDEKDLYKKQLDIFLNPDDPVVISEAERQGIPHNVIEAASKSPVYRMAIDWKVAFPLHPEYRTLPMVWYVPPLSPVVATAGGNEESINGILPEVDQMRIPNRYLANMFTAGDEKPIADALRRMLAMRAYMRSKTVEGKADLSVLEGTGMTPDETEKMYRMMALAHYDERYVIPTSHREKAENVFGDRSGCGFTDDPGCGTGGFNNLFGGR